MLCAWAATLYVRLTTWKFRIDNVETYPKTLQSSSHPLTTENRVLLEKLIVAHLIKIWNSKSITVFRTALDQAISWARVILSTLSCIISFSSLWRYSSNLGFGLPPWNSPFHFGLLDFRQTVGLLGRVIKASTCTQTQKNTHTHKHQTFMPWVGFEPTIPASERAKTVYVLDRSAIVAGIIFLRSNLMLSFKSRLRLSRGCPRQIHWPVMILLFLSCMLQVQRVSICLI
jgi:hypothetical protein